MLTAIRLASSLESNFADSAAIPPRRMRANWKGKAPVYENDSLKLHRTVSVMAIARLSTRR
jgi:hypothetical protein